MGSQPSGVHKYQSLEARKRAHQAALLAHHATDAAFHPRARDLFNQIRRAAASVEANVVEGHALGMTPQFLRHLRIAMGSAAEAESLTRLATELGYLPPEPARELETILGGAMRAIRGLRRSLHSP
jgi:four helix bundle protein